MDAAIKAAVIALLAMAAIVVVITVIYSFFDSRRVLRVGAHSTKVRQAATGPAPIKDNSIGGMDQRVGVSDETIRRRNFILGCLVGSVLGVLFVKLWTMQIAQSDEYSELAKENYTSTFTTRALRGRILDRNGTVLVDNRATLAVMANNNVADDRNLVHRLSNVLGIPRTAIRQRLAESTEGAQASRLVTSEASMHAVAFITEHPEIFSGVSIEERSVRSYPYGTLAAHLLGYTGQISEEELKYSTTADGLAYESSDVVGKSGVEQAYESVLQGVRGTKTVQVDADGNVLGLISEVKSQAGNDVRLCLDLKVQQAAEAAIVFGYAFAAEQGHPHASAGSIVALDLENNGIVAMASNPTFSPAEFSAGISSDLWSSLTSADSGYPLTNRAIAGLYPSASTIKSFSCMAALKYGYADSSSTWTCTGVWTELGEQWAKKCWLLTGHGTLGTIQGLAQSCDVVFYSISLEFWRNRSDAPNALQDEICSWGFGSKTGIDIAGESIGRIPTADWKAKYNSDTPETAQWLPGDMANLIIGQGDVLVTPLQLAVGYSGIATGKIYKPHVLKDVLGADGSTVITHTPEILCTPTYDPDNLEMVHEALIIQAQNNVTWDGFPIQTAGKTGTAQVAGKDDYGLYVGYAPADDPKYLVATCIEQGGGGASVGTPVVRRVMAALFDVNEEDGSVNSSTADDETR